MMFSISALGSLTIGEGISSKTQHRKWHKPFKQQQTQSKICVIFYLGILWYPL